MTTSANQIVRKSISRIAANYPMKPFVLEGIYREVKQVNDTHTFLLEALVEVLGNAYTGFFLDHLFRSRFEKVIVNHCRKFGKNDDPIERMLIFRHNLLTTLMSANDVKYKKSSLAYKLFNYKLLNQETLKGREVFVIETEKNDTPDSGRLYIDVETYAIIKVEFYSVYKKEKSNSLGANLIEVNNRSQAFRVLDSIKIIDFNEMNGKWYLERIFYSWHSDIYNLVADVVESATYFTHELIVNRVNPGRKKYDKQRLMKNTTLEDQTTDSDPALWDKYFEGSGVGRRDEVIETIKQHATL